MLPTSPGRRERRRSPDDLSKPEPATSHVYPTAHVSSWSSPPVPASSGGGSRPPASHPRGQGSAQIVACGWHDFRTPEMSIGRRRWRNQGRKCDGRTHAEGSSRDGGAGGAGLRERRRPEGISATSAPRRCCGRVRRGRAVTFGWRTASASISLIRRLQRLPSARDGGPARRAGHLRRPGRRARRGLRPAWARRLRSGDQSGELRRHDRQSLLSRSRPARRSSTRGRPRKGFEHDEFAVTHNTKVILGVTCVEVHDTRQGRRRAGGGHARLVRPGHGRQRLVLRREHGRARSTAGSSTLDGHLHGRRRRRQAGHHHEGRIPPSATSIARSSTSATPRTWRRWSSLTDYGHGPVSGGAFTNCLTTTETTPLETDRPREQVLRRRRRQRADRRCAHRRPDRAHCRSRPGRETGCPDGPSGADEKGRESMRQLLCWVCS